MPESDHLLPCPFCGCEDVNYFNGWALGDRYKDTSDHREPCVTCENCEIGMAVGTFGRGIDDDYARAKTIEAWNRRPKKVFLSK